MTKGSVLGSTCPEPSVAFRVSGPVRGVQLGNMARELQTSRTCGPGNINNLPPMKTKSILLVFPPTHNLNTVNMVLMGFPVTQVET